MKFIKTSLFAAILLTGFTGCAGNRQFKPLLIEPRPLGREIETFHAPSQLNIDSAPSSGIKEPRGNITLTQALSLALLNNPELASFSYEIRAMEAKRLQAGLLPNPEVDIEAENLGGDGNFHGTNVAETTIQLSQIIELGSKRSKRLRVANLKHGLSMWNYEVERIDILKKVTLAFIGLLAAQDRLRLAEEMVNLAEQVYYTVSERVKAGKVSPIEEIKARVALSGSKIENKRAVQEVMAAKKRLSFMWGNPLPVFDKAIGELYTIKPIPPLARLTYLISQNPEIQRMDENITHLKAVVELERAKVIPNLRLSGGVRLFNETNNSAFVIGASIPIPVFNRNQGGLMEARFRHIKAKKDRLATEIRVRTALAEAYMALSTAFSEAASLKEEILPSAKTAFDAAKEGYRYGKFNYLDVLDAQRTLFAVKARYIGVLTSYHKAVAEVEGLIGERLDAVMDTDQIKKERGER